MTRYRQWAIAALDKLREKLGNRCRQCGGSGELQFDCVEPRGHRHHTFETNRRACFYRREDKAGNLQLLCPTCHQEKSKSEQYWMTAENPF